MEEKYQSTEHSIDLGRLHEFVRQHGENLLRVQETLVKAAFGL